MPTQQEIEAIKAAHVDAMRQVIARVQPKTPIVAVIPEDVVGIHISPFGAVPDGGQHRAHSSGPATLGLTPMHEANADDPSLVASGVALLLGFVFVYRLLRQLLDE